MPSIAFYRQKRRDGGVRSGADVGSDKILSRFESGSKDRDPTLVWYVDVRAEGPAVPSSPEAARQWPAAHTADVAAALLELADDLPAGVDPRHRPVERTVMLDGQGRRRTTLSISVAFVRRTEAARLPATLRDIADHWGKYVGELVAA